MDADGPAFLGLSALRVRIRRGGRTYDDLHSIRIAAVDVKAGDTYADEHARIGSHHRQRSGGGEHGQKSKVEHLRGEQDDRKRRVPVLSSDAA